MELLRENSISADDSANFQGPVGIFYEVDESWDRRLVCDWLKNYVKTVILAGHVSSMLVIGKG